MTGSEVAEPRVAHAQTNVQLFNQLLSAGYRDKEIARIAEAYRLAAQLFSGLFRQSGKTLLDHSVGVASILASQPPSADVVAAALLHAAYEHGDFGTHIVGAIAPHRKRLRQVVGEAAEELIFRFDARRPHDAIAALHARHARLDPVERGLSLLRLANRLESHLDGADRVGESAVRRRKRLARDAPLCIELAYGLEFPALAAEFDRAVREVRDPPTVHPQTNLQLLDQMKRTGYPADDLDCVARAYGLAARLFGGCYISSGKTLIAHCVGTAGVLAAERAPAIAVAAGLLHCSYRDDASWPVPDRARVRSEVGSEVEVLVFQFGGARWDTASIALLVERLPPLDTQDRATVLLRLAHVVDQFCDNGIFYGPHPSAQRDWLREVGPALFAVSRGVGAPGMAARLDAIAGEPAFEPPKVLRSRNEDVVLVRRTRYNLKAPSLAWRRLRRFIRHRFQS